MDAPANTSDIKALTVLAKDAAKVHAAAAKAVTKALTAVEKAGDDAEAKAAEKIALKEAKAAEKIALKARREADAAVTKAEKQAAKPPKEPKEPKPEGRRSTDLLAEKAKSGAYQKDKEHKTAAGNPSIHCGDDVAKKLLGQSLDDCYAIAAKVCEMAEKELRAKYAHLNVGMQRMNLGNKMRGILHAK